MTPQEFQKELLFGLENLGKVKNEIDAFQRSPADPEMRNSAIAYACIGYFNALEHLMVRLLKFLKATLPTGPTSHQMILTQFQEALVNLSVPFTDFDALKRLLGFRHVATKIYGFLIDEEKLKEVAATIQVKHVVFIELFNKIIQKITSSPS